MHFSSGSENNRTPATEENTSVARTERMLLRLVRAAQPISRVEIANRLGVNRSTATEIARPLIESGILIEVPAGQETVRGSSGGGSPSRPRVGLKFNRDDWIFGGIHIGVHGSQIGLTTLSGEILCEETVETHSDPRKAIQLLRDRFEQMRLRFSDRELKNIGISVPRATDSTRSRLIYAPHLNWKDIDFSNTFQTESQGAAIKTKRVIVENDATAVARYEARMKHREGSWLLKDFILVRSGTGIGVGLVIDNEIYRGKGNTEGIAGEFGHMTIVAGGKPCVCGNRGCWERYAAASAASSLYVGDRKQLGTMTAPRYVEIVERAEAGEIRARRTLEKIGEYLGIGIGNVIAGIGVSHAILSGRIVYGWKFFREPLEEAVRKSIRRNLSDWSIEAGEPRDTGLGGAFEIAVEEYLSSRFNSVT